MDDPAEDLVRVITSALMEQRYSPPQRRRAAWHEGFDEDQAEAQRVARAICEALSRAGYTFSRREPGPPISFP